MSRVGNSLWILGGWICLDARCLQVFKSKKREQNEKNVKHKANLKTERKKKDKENNIIESKKQKLADEKKKKAEITTKNAKEAEHKSVEKSVKSKVTTAKAQQTAKNAETQEKADNKKKQADLEKAKAAEMKVTSSSFLEFGCPSVCRTPAVVSGAATNGGVKLVNGYCTRQASKKYGTKRYCGRKGKAAYSGAGAVACGA